MAAQMNSISLVIAGFSIRLFSDHEIQLEDGYLPFVETQDVAEPDFTVHCIEHMPGIDLDASDLLFQAENEFQKFYSVYSTGSQLAFVIYNQQTSNEIQQIAFLDESFKHWTVHCEVVNGLFSTASLSYGAYHYALYYAQNQCGDDACFLRLRWNESAFVHRFLRGW